jgi:CRISPR-associated protein Cas5t
MKVLKFEIFTPLAVFKTIFSIKGFETYPLPPYSTVIGLLYTALGRKYKGERFQISVQGRYEVLFRDYQIFRKYNRKDKKLEKKPLEVPYLYNFRLLCHIGGDENLLNTFVEALRKPKTFLSLGIAEIPAKVRFAKILSADLKERKLKKTLKWDAYIPKHLVNDIKFSSPYRTESRAFAGIEFLLPSFLKKEEPYRDYYFEEVLYLPAGFGLSGKLLMDEEGDFLFLTEEQK